MTGTSTLPRSRARRAFVAFVIAGLVGCGSVVAIVEGRLAWQGRAAAQAQDSLIQRLESAPVAQSIGTGTAGHRPRIPVAGGAEIGDPFAVLEVPRWGEDWEWAVVEGTEAEQIDLGPGHYTETAMPGAVGNVGIAAHRAGHGDPFIDFDLLQDGDEVLLRQGQVTWVYELTMDPRIVAATDVWVLDALPGRWLTLTTCWPKWSSEKRMYVRARLTRVLTPEGEISVDDSGKPVPRAAQPAAQ